MSLLWLYKKTMQLGTPFLKKVLLGRAEKGKEDWDRLHEKHGTPSLPRPDGPLIWIHAASVGEAQSMLRLVHLILEQIPTAHVLITTITVTAANLLATRLPDRAFHQYLPADQPAWARRFVDHWAPDLVLWAESELWPNILTLLKKRHTPVALLNARLSAKSFRNWSKIRKSAEDLLSTFYVVLTQTEQDKDYYTQLGARSVTVTDNIKYSADPLPCNESDLSRFTAALADRPVWLYASTHDGEEQIAAKVHKALSAQLPGLLTIVAPRHPDRRDSIAAALAPEGINVQWRGPEKSIPESSTDLYIADTLGEMGLLFRTAPITCIGRSLSRDGGGGHNPLEPALLSSAVLHGPNIQNLQEIYDDMDLAGAARCVETPEELSAALLDYLSNPNHLKSFQELGYTFARSKSQILNRVIEELEPLFLQANLPVLKAP